jgi:ABC-type nitrate/sulfonate/bicarbonate transport system substrate-binding protein
MLRSVLKTLTVLMLILCLDVSAKGATEPTEFDVGISGNGVTFFTLWMAEAGGFFKKAGLNVHVIDLPGGTRSLQVLLAGKIAATHAGLGPVTQANNQGADLRMIASTSNTIPFTIFSNPNVKTAADLKEGKVGISTFGSEADLAVALALKQLGLNRKDVMIVQIGENATRLQALLAGQLTATPLAEPMASMARAQGLNPLIDFTAVPWVSTGVVVKRNQLEIQRGIVTSFLRAYIEGAYLAWADEQQAKQVIKLKYKTNDAKAINATYNEFKRIMPADAEPSRAGAENVFEQMQAIGLNVGSRKIEDHISNDMIQSLRTEGFFNAMKRKYNIP